MLVHGRISPLTGFLLCTAACVLLEMWGCRGCAYQVMLTFGGHWGHDCQEILSSESFLISVGTVAWEWCTVLPLFKHKTFLWL